MRALEEGIGRSFDRYIQAARSHFGYGSRIHFEFGLVNVAGYRLTLPDETLSDEVFEDLKVTDVLEVEAQGGANAVNQMILREVYELPVWFAVSVSGCRIAAPQLRMTADSVVSRSAFGESIEQSSDLRATVWLANSIG